VGGIHGMSRWQSADMRLYFMFDPLLSGSLVRRREVVWGQCRPEMVGVKSDRRIRPWAKAGARELT